MQVGNFLLDPPEELGAEFFRGPGRQYGASRETFWIDQRAAHGVQAVQPEAAFRLGRRGLVEEFLIWWAVRLSFGPAFRLAVGAFHARAYSEKRAIGNAWLRRARPEHRPNSGKLLACARKEGLAFLA